MSQEMFLLKQEIVVLLADGINAVAPSEKDPAREILRSPLMALFALSIADCRTRRCP